MLIRSSSFRAAHLSLVGLLISGVDGYRKQAKLSDGFPRRADAQYWFNPRRMDLENRMRRAVFEEFVMHCIQHLLGFASKQWKPRGITGSHRWECGEQVEGSS